MDVDNELHQKSPPEAPNLTISENTGPLTPTSSLSNLAQCLSLNSSTPTTTNGPLNRNPSKISKFTFLHFFALIKFLYCIIPIIELCFEDLMPLVRAIAFQTKLTWR